MWLTDGFSVTVFWKVEGTVCIHVNSHVANVWLPYMVINVQGEGNEHWKTQKTWKFSNLHKGDREHCQPHWIS